MKLLLQHRATAVRSVRSQSNTVKRDAMTALDIVMGV